MAKKRLQVDLSDEAYAHLTKVAQEEGRPVAEVVRRALNIEDYLRQAQQEGRRVLIEDRNGATRELLVA